VVHDYHGWLCSVREVPEKSHLLSLLSYERTSHDTLLSQKLDTSDDRTGVTYEMHENVMAAFVGSLKFKCYVVALLANSESIERCPTEAARLAVVP
jgi:hypothetical protein